MPPTMHPVVSSNVASIGHDGKDLHVAYKSGGTYVYRDVLVATFQEARAAKSVGGYLAANVKGKHEVAMTKEAPLDALEEMIGRPMPSAAPSNGQTEGFFLLEWGQRYPTPIGVQVHRSEHRGLDAAVTDARKVLLYEDTVSMTLSGPWTLQTLMAFREKASA